MQEESETSKSAVTQVLELNEIPILPAPLSPHTFETNINGTPSESTGSNSHEGAENTKADPSKDDKNFIMDTVYVTLNDTKTPSGLGTSLFQQSPGGTVGTRMDSVVYNIGTVNRHEIPEHPMPANDGTTLQNNIFSEEIYRLLNKKLPVLVAPLIISLLITFALIIYIITWGAMEKKTVTQITVEKFTLVKFELDKHLDSLAVPLNDAAGGISFNMISVNVTHWQDLQTSNINERILNFILATTWSQCICEDARNIDLLASYKLYLHKTLETLNKTSTTFNEYEFIDKFRNISVVVVEDAEELIYHTLPEGYINVVDDYDIHTKFVSFLQICVGYIASFVGSNDSHGEATNCMIVRSFNEIRNLLFKLNDHKETLYVSEMSSNIFTFASYLEFHYEEIKKMAISVDDENLPVIENVYSFLGNSLCQLERDYNLNGDSLQILKKQLFHLTKKTFCPH